MAGWCDYICTSRELLSRLFCVYRSWTTRSLRCLLWHVLTGRMRLRRRKSSKGLLEVKEVFAAGVLNSNSLHSPPSHPPHLPPHHFIHSLQSCTVVECSFNIVISDSVQKNTQVEQLTREACGTVIVQH